MESNFSASDSILESSNNDFISENSSFIEDSLNIKDLKEELTYNIYELTVGEMYMNHRGLIIASQLALVLLFFLKYFAPKALRNTQHKLIAFMYLVSAF